MRGVSRSGSFVKLRNSPAIADRDVGNEREQGRGSVADRDVGGRAAIAETVFDRSTPNESAT